MATSGFGNSTFRWSTGFITEAALTSTYDIVNFPIFSNERWNIPEFPSPFNQAASTVNNLAGGSGFVGKRNTAWTLVGLNDEMLDYVYNNAALFNGYSSMNSTISTWNIGKRRWEVVWVKSTIGTLSGSEQGTYTRLMRQTVNHLITQDAP